MKNTSKTILVLFLLFIGLANTQAAANDCLLDVFQAELNEKGSDELYDYFYNRSEEDLKNAYEAWMVLYQADEKVDRLNIENLETVYAFMASAEITVEEMVENIKLANGFESWKNLDYQFQKEGYTYVPEEVMEGDTKRFNHKIQRNGKIINIGHSKITPAGIVHNLYDTPKNFREKGLSKAIYKRLIKEKIREIKSFYINSTDDVNFRIFTDTHNALKDLEKAAMATPQGKVFGRQFYPDNINIKNAGVFLTWKRRDYIKGVDNATEPWMNDIPYELMIQIDDDKDKFLDLFKKADPTQREKLVKAWEVLRNAADLYNKPWMIVTLSKIGDKFTYKGEEGFKAMNPLFYTYSDGMPNMNRLDQEILIVQRLEDMRRIFKDNPNLPIRYTIGTQFRNNFPVLIDGIGDEIMRVVNEGKAIEKRKFFQKVDASYEKVGEFDGFDIYRKGDEIGFKPADVIKINRKK